MNLEDGFARPATHLRSTTSCKRRSARRRNISTLLARERSAVERRKSGTFPSANPHSLSCLGEKACHFILIIDDGHFSELSTFSIADWLGHASRALLAKNFGLPEATLDGFHRQEGRRLNPRILVRLTITVG